MGKQYSIEECRKRNEEIIRLYHEEKEWEGSLGRKFGLSRQRVLQIVQADKRKREKIKSMQQ
jgi:hypothetical protein